MGGDECVTHLSRQHTYLERCFQHHILAFTRVYKLVKSIRDIPVAQVGKGRKRRWGGGGEGRQTKDLTREGERERVSELMRKRVEQGAGRQPASQRGREQRSEGGREGSPENERREEGKEVMRVRLYPEKEEDVTSFNKMGVKLLFKAALAGDKSWEADEIRGLRSRIVEVNGKSLPERAKNCRVEMDCRLKWFVTRQVILLCLKMPCSIRVRLVRAS